MVEENNNTGRNPVFDISKGLAIILIVFGHIDTSTFPCYFVHLFHVPFFFFLSGYFLKDKYYENIKTVFEFIKKRFKRLCIPYLMCNLIFLFLHNLCLKINLYTTNPLFLEGYTGNYFGLDTPAYSKKQIFIKSIWTILFARQENLVGATWFLKVLFFVSLIFIIVSYLSNKFSELCKNKYFYAEIIRGVSLVFLTICGFILSVYDKSNIWLFGTVLSSLLPFYIGYLFAKYKKNINLNIKYFVLCFIILLSLNFVLPQKISISANFYYNPLLLALLTVTGFLMLLALSEFINKIFKNKVKNIFILLGQNTMPILCLHIIAFKAVTLLQVLIYNLPDYRLASYFTYKTDSGWWILYLFIGLCIPVCINQLYKYFKSLLIRN